MGVNIKLIPITDDNGNTTAYMFYCPGCEHHHAYYVSGKLVWQFNQNLDSPTFTPSLLNRVPCDGLEPHIPEKICHIYLTDGIIHFLNDCTHKLAGQKVPLQEDE
jgi:hypothetical protein